MSVIPGEGGSAEEVGGPIDRNGVKFLKVLNQVVGALFTNIFDSKVVDHERKTDVQCRFIPGGSSARDRSITKLCKM